MRWTEKVRSIIAGLRKQGRSEDEVEMIVRQAAEKATVKTTQKQVDEFAEAAGETMRKMIGKLQEVGMTTEETTVALMALRNERRQQTNNWRKMHGLPMRRKGKRR